MKDDPRDNPHKTLSKNVTSSRENKLKKLEEIIDFVVTSVSGMTILYFSIILLIRITLILSDYPRVRSKQQKTIFFTVFEQGKYILYFACVGAFIGGLTGHKLLSIAGAFSAGLYGFFYYKCNKTDSHFAANYSKNKIHNDIWLQGKHMLSLASGGAFIGGLIGQIPGAIIGCVIGVALSFIQ